MGLDATTRRNLELTHTLREGRSEGSLLSILDRAETASAVPASEVRQADTNGDGQLSQGEYMVPFAKKEAMFAPHYK